MNYVEAIKKKLDAHGVTDADIWMDVELPVRLGNGNVGFPQTNAARSKQIYWRAMMEELGGFLDKFDTTPAPNDWYIKYLRARARRRLWKTLKQHVRWFFHLD
ncbi:MAG TPA: hypothetical protein VKT73_15295 [Xanthobacteraceae bacterium]|nr:hypothetical protein [Xanthobacteraceae bacterium]